MIGVGVYVGDVFGESDWEKAMKALKRAGPDFVDAGIEVNACGFGSVLAPRNIVGIVVIGDFAFTFESERSGLRRI